MNMGIKDELLSHNDEKDVWILEKSNSTRLGEHNIFDTKLKHRSNYKSQVLY